MKDTNVSGLKGRCADGLEPFEKGAAVAPSSCHAATWGRSKVLVHQLRDPAIYVEHDDLYLLYSGAGETNIGIARLHLL